MRAGFSRRTLDVEVGTPIGGNTRADRASRGTHDPLHATVAVFSDDEREPIIVLIGMDVLAVPTTLRERIVGAIAATSTRPALSIDVFATHTHSGPDTIRGGGFQPGESRHIDDWEDRIVPLVAEAVAEACAKQVPATIRTGIADVHGFAFNRRVPQRDGSVRMNWTPSGPDDELDRPGPVDPEFTILAVFDGDGTPLGAIGHFALHPAVLVGHEWLVSADYVEGIDRLVSHELGGVPLLYMSGALGNINHLDTHVVGRAIGFDEAARIGTGIGAEVVALLSSIRTEKSTPATVWHDRFTVHLAQRTLTAAALTAARTTVRDHGSAPADEVDGIPAISYARWALDHGASLDAQLPVSVSIVGIGPVVFVLLPFEVFVEFGIRLRAANPDLIVKVVSLANDYLGYLPTLAAFAEGGYEPTLGTSTIEPGEGERLFQTISNRLLALRKGDTTHELV